ncbi:MAG: GDP-mannose 4,6-dehydratase, partial [Ktedonobacterales bacterium]|nr:GDP-mannose 4,6-dehydratase [Ktedonobacterales bacterium]
MRCLVTGVAGFIGSHLAERLIADGHEVLGIDTFTDYYPRPFKVANLTLLRQAERFRFVEADLNALDLAATIADRDWVFHQAAQAGVRASWGQSFEIYTACNITATQRLLEAATHAPTLKRLVYASSSSVYGNAPELPVTEETLTRPVSPYGVTKLAAEHLCSLYWHTYQ